MLSFQSCLHFPPRNDRSQCGDRSRLCGGQSMCDNCPMLFEPLFYSLIPCIVIITHHHCNKPSGKRNDKFLIVPFTQISQASWPTRSNLGIGVLPIDNWTRARNQTADPAVGGWLFYLFSFCIDGKAGHSEYAHLIVWAQNIAKARPDQLKQPQIITPKSRWWLFWPGSVSS